jgi:hypothetical protein
MKTISIAGLSWSQKGGTMKDDLRELIQDARRAVRLASGVPLNPDEQAEERRLKETKEMNLFAYETFGFKLMDALKSTIIWTAKGATVEMRADEHVFHLRKDKGAYALFAIEDQAERELLRIDGKDPIFANRVLVAIGDFNLDAKQLRLYTSFQIEMPDSYATFPDAGFYIPQPSAASALAAVSVGPHGPLSWVLLSSKKARMEAVRKCSKAETSSIEMGGPNRDTTEDWAARIATGRWPSSSPTA